MLLGLISRDSCWHMPDARGTSTAKTHEYEHKVLDPSCQHFNLEGEVFSSGDCLHGHVSIICVTSSVIGQRYRGMHVHLQRSTGDLFIQQHNTPYHRSRIVSEWLDRHFTDVNFLSRDVTWSQSHCALGIWDGHRKLYSDIWPSSNLRELWKIVQGSWICMPSKRFIVEYFKAKSRPTLFLMSFKVKTTDADLLLVSALK